MITVVSKVPARKLTLGKLEKERGNFTWFDRTSLFYFILLYTFYILNIGYLKEQIFPLFPGGNYKLTI